MRSQFHDQLDALHAALIAMGALCEGAIACADDAADGLFVRVKSEMCALISEDRTRGEAALDTLLIAKYLERIGDHAVGIAQWVIYAVTGRHEGEEA